MDFLDMLMLVMFLLSTTIISITGGIYIYRAVISFRASQKERKTR